MARLRRKRDSKAVRTRLDEATGKYVQMLAEQRNIGLGVAVALLAKEGLRSIATRRLASGNHTVTVRLDDAEFEEVKVIAKQRGIDVASAVNLLVKRALLNKSKPPG